MMRITVFVAMALLFGMIGMAHAADNVPKNKILTVYFSWSGNTRFIAGKIHQKVGGDLFEILTVDPYPTSYGACMDQAEKEAERQSRPTLASHVEDMSQYALIFLGYPNWWHTIPMPVASFLEEYDFSGKTIVPFCSHGGGGLAETVSAVENLCPDSNILEAIAIYSRGGRKLERDIDVWLNKVGMEKASSPYQEQPAPSSENMSSRANHQSIDMQESSESAMKKNGGKTLIAYFSLIGIVPKGADAVAHATPVIGNTESAALEIQRQVGGELFAIQTVKTYPISHSECSAIAEEEMKTDDRPELSTHVEDMSEYDIVYLGYPIWWYIEPMAIRTFLEEYDFSGKTIIPFCTSLGAGVDESVKNIADHAEGAAVLDGITLRTGRENMSDEIAERLTEIGVAE